MDICHDLLTMSLRLNKTPTKNKNWIHAVKMDDTYCIIIQIYDPSHTHTHYTHTHTHTHTHPHTHTHTHQPTQTHTHTHHDCLLVMCRKLSHYIVALHKLIY